MSRRYPLAELERREVQRDRWELVGIALVIVVAVIVGSVWQAARSSATERDPFASFNETWTVIPPDVIDTLTESGLPHADSRRWELCAIHWGATASRIICPGGYTTRY